MYLVYLCPPEAGLPVTSWQVDEHRMSMGVMLIRYEIHDPESRDTAMPCPYILVYD